MRPGLQCAVMAHPGCADLSIIAATTFPAVSPFAALGMGIGVAGHAIFDVADAFLPVLADKRGFVMFVAEKAGEPGEIIGRGVASNASCNRASN